MRRVSPDLLTSYQRHLGVLRAESIENVRSPFCVNRVADAVGLVVFEDDDQSWASSRARVGEIGAVRD